MIRGSYSYTANSKEFINVDWKGKRTTVYIPAGLNESVFKRSLVARGLQKVREARHEEMTRKRLREEDARLFRQNFPILHKLDDDRVVEITLSTDSTEMIIEESCDCYYDVRLTKSEARQLIAELSTLVDMMVEGEVWTAHIAEPRCRRE